jgi:hypothetical protein
LATLAGLPWGPQSPSLFGQFWTLPPSVGLPLLLARAKFHCGQRLQREVGERGLAFLQGFVRHRRGSAAEDQ